METQLLQGIQLISSYMSKFYPLPSPEQHFKSIVTLIPWTNEWYIRRGVFGHFISLDFEKSNQRTKVGSKMDSILEYSKNNWRIHQFHKLCSQQKDRNVFHIITNSIQIKYSSPLRVIIPPPILSFIYHRSSQSAINRIIAIPINCETHSGKTNHRTNQQGKIDQSKDYISIAVLDLRDCVQELNLCSLIQFTILSATNTKESKSQNSKGEKHITNPTETA